MEQYFRTRASVDDNPNLARDRRANDARLKSRFEHIFAKYGKDFDGVGDEIDLETGHIIVNNGHIARMQHEVDPGQGTSAQVLRVLGGSRQGDSVKITHGEEPVVEDSAEEMEDDDELAVIGTSGYSGSDNDDENESEELPKTWARAPDELSSDFYPIENATPERVQPISRLSGQKPAARRQVDNNQAMGLPRATSRSKSPDDLPAEMPLLRESMRAMQALPGQHGSVDPDVIQALGQSIANQLAKFMTGDLKKSRRKSPSQRAPKDSRWEYPKLPGDRIERTPSPSLPESPSAAVFATSPNHEASVWAPQQRRARRKSKLQDQVRHITGVNGYDDDDDDNDGIDPLQSDPPSYMTTTIGDEAEGILDIDCYNCGATNSRVWRTGPGGRLCDSCGTYYRRYGLLKAVENPSFTPVLRPGGARPGAHDRRLPTNQETDVFAIPSTDAPEVITGYAANTARRVTGDGRNGRFTLEEEVSIIRHYEIDQLSWDHIGYLLSLRSAHSVHSHYQKFLKAPTCEARRRLVNPSARAQPAEIDGGALEHHSRVAEPESTEDTHSDDVSGFIEREDELIIRLREDEGMTWEQIAAYFPDRTSHTLQARYNDVLAENESLSSVSDLDAHTLEVQSRTISDGSLTSKPVQTTHNAPDARQTTEDQFTASGGCNSDAPGIDATPSMSDPYAMIMNMRDEKALPFIEMARLFRDRTEEPSFEPYSRTKARLANYEVGHIAGTPGNGAGANSLPIKSAWNVDTRIQMPPPHVPSRQPAALRYHDEKSSVSAGRDRAQRLHTPSVHARQVSVPPGPSEVGPSAWAITQPASKGPLPFQPARKGLVPIYPKSSSRGLNDPFISRPIVSGDFAPPHVQNTVSKSRQQSSNTTASNNAVVSDSRHSVFPELVGNIAQNPYEPSASSPGFTAEQDKFIKKAREKHRLAWAEIAERLPGDVQHTASAITHRYYDYLLGRRSANETPKSQETRANANDRRPHSEVQSGQIPLYSHQGISRTEMINQIPAPSSVHVEDYSRDHNRKDDHQQVASYQRHSSKPLLRRALNNSTRRNSDVAHTGTLTEDYLQGLHHPNGGTSSDSHSVPGSRRFRHSHPEVVISSGEFDSLDEAFSKTSDLETSKSARSKVRSKPARLLEETPMQENLDQCHGLASGFEAASSHEYAPVDDDDQAQDGVFCLVQESQSFKEVLSSGTKRKRRSGHRNRVSDVEVADSDSDTHLNQDTGNKSAGDTRMTPTAKRGRGRPRKTGPSSIGAFSREVIPESEQVQVEPTEPISPKLRSGLIRTAVEDGAKSVTRNAPHRVVGTWAAPKNLDESPMAAHESTNHPDGAQDGQELSFNNWGEIVLAAFRSQPGAVLRCNELAAWVREHSAHYRHTEEPWIHHLYNEVYRNPAFEKADPRQRKSGYILVESNVPPETTEHTGGDVGTKGPIESSVRSISGEFTVDDIANKGHAAPDMRPASAEDADPSFGTQDEPNVRPTSVKSPGQDVETSIRPSSKQASHNVVGNRESVDGDALVDDLPALASPVSRANIVEIIDISSDSPIKQEPASESRLSPFHSHHTTKRPLHGQEQSPRAKHIRYSDPALVRRASALVTPAYSSANSGRRGSHAQSTVPTKFESLSRAPSRASPATSIGTSGRRVLVATEVARDDGAEQDELS